MAANSAIDPYEKALAQTLADRAANGEELYTARRRVLALEQRDTQLARLARTLAKEMPERRRAHYLRAHPWLSEGPDPASRQAVLMGIVQTFMSAGARELTPPDVEQALEKQGIHADTKRVYNALNYLASDGRLRRASRGRYSAGPALYSTSTKSPEEAGQG